MSRWWRVEDTSIDHPKLLLLSDSMHRAWYTLMCVASANGGELPPVEHIAARLRMKPGQVAAWITHLVTAGLFDNDAGTFRPHNWAKRQYKTDVTDPTNATRQKRYRNKHRNAVTTVTDKRPETETETETETDQKERVRAKRATRLPDDWVPTKSDQMFALDHGMSIEGTKIEATKFRNYWTAKGGQGAAKTNWERTWQNWVLNSKGSPNGNRAANQRSTGHDAILAAATKAARKIIGDSPVAGTADEDKFSFRGEPFGGREPGFNGTSGGAAPGHNGRESGAGPVLEGEVIPFDKANAGLSGGRRGV